jgi:hypothetical protein
MGGLCPLSTCKKKPKNDKSGKNWVENGPWFLIFEERTTDMSKMLVGKLVDTFKEKPFFTRDELFAFYRQFEPELKEGTFAWRVYELKKQGVIQSVKSGLYVVSEKPEFMPYISQGLLKVAKITSAKYANIALCMWETTWLNEFMLHQLTKPTLIVEVEKGFEDSVFYALQDWRHQGVFLNPDEKAMEYYLPATEHPVVVNKLISRSPLTERTENGVGLCLPTLEKILVDLIAEDVLFHYLQGNELIHIYESALSKYTINYSRLFNYARRRDKEDEIKKLMYTHMFHLIEGVFNDKGHMFHE